jgi:hypothetical protein
MMPRHQLACLLCVLIGSDRDEVLSMDVLNVDRLGVLALGEAACA